MSNAMTPLDLTPFFRNHPILETERLLLRQLKRDDAAAVFEYASDPEVTKYMIFPTHTSIQNAIDFLETVPRDFADRKRIEFGMETKAGGELIGVCGVHHLAPEHHRLEIGYVLRRSAWGQGYMPEAVCELIRFAFEEMGMHRVEAHCDVGNDRSARVLERCGMTHEATYRDWEIRFGRYVSTKVYASIR